MVKSKRNRSDTLDEQFEDIGNRAIEEAERVDCALEDFVDGCRALARQFNTRADISEEECRNDEEK